MSVSPSRGRFFHLDQHRWHFHHYPEKKLVLRDWLAADRTAAGNRRTFYSYLRTTLDFLIAGLVLIRFFDYAWIIAIGIFFLVTSGFLGGYGIYRFYTVRRHYFTFMKEKANVFPQCLVRVSRTGTSRK